MPELLAHMLVLIAKFDAFHVQLLAINDDDKQIKGCFRVKRPLQIRYGIVI